MSEMQTSTDAPRHRREHAPDQLPLRSRLWFRNVVAGVIVIAVFSGVWAVSFRDSWRDYRASVVPLHVIATGQSGDAYGQTWRLAGVRRLGKAPRGANGVIPKGAELAVVTIERSGPVPQNFFCDGRITDGEHQWPEAPFLLYTVTPPDGVVDHCDKPGNLQFSFLVPDDVTMTAVDLVNPVGGSAQILVRFELS
ncbi:hypothetical protein MSTE_02281 [Mycobacteroides stephanolepidis]|uniref:DUF4352 domain-containing protein n=1 Tax=[Mycobacterium] stephanolepidis TaxID=1520670 RepID=A0A1Z4EXD3_9MYCO|nr:hypothetical protein [[Mycobacterium] stephanolepidis]BAX97594.1 hypothetical protein MSTE_02281 [[Mycobacterium] stephanolepidis]